MLNISDDEFKLKVLETNGAVLVIYWASWCHPCSMLEIALTEIDGTEGLSIVKIDLEEHRSSATDYAVRATPTLMLFKGGELQFTKVGAMSSALLMSFIEPHL
jgi:thioredoxin 1